MVNDKLEVYILIAKNRNKALAVRPDKIVEARYQLTAMQNDILDIFLADIKDDDGDKLVYRIYPMQYKALFGKDRSNLYKQLKEAVKTFEKSGFYIYEDDTGKDTWYSWFASITYNNLESCIDLEVGQKLKKLLLEMKRAVFYKLEYSLMLQSIYAKRIYYMAKEYEDTGFRIDRFEDLLKKLNCPESYSKYGLFRTKVLEPAQEQINAHTDILIEFEGIKEGRKISRIKFTIRKKNNMESKLDLSEELDKAIPKFKEKLKAIFPHEYEHRIDDYIRDTLKGISFENVSYPVKYAEKILEADTNINQFISNLKELERMTQARADAELQRQKAESQLQQQKEDSIKEKMIEYGVSTPEALNEILRKKWEPTKNRKNTK